MILRYLKILTLTILLYVPARILRRIHPRYRGLWLIAERGRDARDNGYWFFRYLREEQPQVNACFVITSDSADHDKVAELGPTVAYGSFRHYLMYLAADVLAGTHVQPAAPDCWAYYRLSGVGIRARGLQVFLQHGITKDNVAHLHYPGLHVDLFICGARPEADYLTAEYGHPNGVVRYTGFPRYDALSEETGTGREILMMPTWRGSAYPGAEAFTQTAFYRAYQELLEAPALGEYLAKQDLKLIFYPHTEMQKELHHFTSPSDRIILADQEHYDVQTLLKSCSLLITDYSSVFFDVAYQGKPVIYYQFDREEYRRRLYAEGYFSYDRDGFGPVVYTKEDVLDALQAAAANGFHAVAPYKERAEKFFPLRDRHNCARILQAILDLLKQV